MSSMTDAQSASDSASFGGVQARSAATINAVSRISVRTSISSTGPTRR
jgi:hypothetical protein